MLKTDNKTNNRSIISKVTTTIGIALLCNSLVRAQGIAESAATRGMGVQGLHSQSKNLSKIFNKKKGFYAPGQENIGKHAHSSVRRHYSQVETSKAGQESNKFYRLAEQSEKAGKLDEAKSLYYKAASARTKLWGKEDPAVAKISLQIGQIESKQGHASQARIWFKNGLSVLSKIYGPGSFELMPPLSQLAELEAKEKNHEEASLYYDHLLALQERKLGEENKQCFPTRVQLAKELMAAKDLSEAEEVLNKAKTIADKAGETNTQSYNELKQLLVEIQTARAANQSK